MTTNTPTLTPPRVYKDPSGNIYRIVVYAEDGRTFHAVTQTDLLNRDWETALSDAHLIGASSDLLAALHNLERMISTRHTSDFDWCHDAQDRRTVEAARAAIAKANDDGTEGREPNTFKTSGTGVNAALVVIERAEQ
ncbi:MAG: hypothetical protein IH905_15025 [Proteobacteria bacterium]|nr:hypothetical protein [Pseudomonadota bacterium]